MTSCGLHGPLDGISRATFLFLLEESVGRGAEAGRHSATQETRPGARGLWGQLAAGKGGHWERPCGHPEAATGWPLVLHSRAGSKCRPAARLGLLGGPRRGRCTLGWRQVRASEATGRVHHFGGWGTTQTHRIRVYIPTGATDPPRVTAQGRDGWQLIAYSAAIKTQAKGPSDAPGRKKQCLTLRWPGPGSGCGLPDTAEGGWVALRDMANVGGDGEDKVEAAGARAATTH